MHIADLQALTTETEALKVVVIQSNYIPWKGYFSLIAEADTFVFYDDVQFTKNDWRNRNRIKTPNGPLWLTIPVGQALDRLINEVELTDSSWQKKHFKSLQFSYQKAPYFERYLDFLKETYLNTTWRNLSELNQFLIKTIATEFLGISCRFENSSDYQLKGTKEDRLLDLLSQVGATEYISGPAARDYLSPSRFENLGIKLTYFDYRGYPEYPQLHPPFIHEVSILDVLFHCGGRSALMLQRA